jgi:hypothetical protein
MDQATRIWSECLTNGSEANLLPLEIVMRFSVDQLAARNPVLSTGRAGSRMPAGCAGRQAPLGLKLKTKAAFLPFEPEIVATL